MGATRGLFIERFSNGFRGWDHVTKGYKVLTGAAYPNSHDADPDPAFHFDAILIPDPDSAFHFDAARPNPPKIMQHRF
jgi:hypothetical protein